VGSPQVRLTLSTRAVGKDGTVPTRIGADDLNRTIEILRRLVGEPTPRLGSVIGEVSAALGAVASATESHEVVRLVVDHAVRALEADAGLVGWMSEGGQLSSVVSGRQEGAPQTLISFQLIESLAQEALRNGPVLLDRKGGLEPDETAEANGATMVLPVAGMTGPPAVLHISRAGPSVAFTRPDVEVASIFAQLIRLAERLCGDWAGEEGRRARVATAWRTQSQALERELAAWHTIAQKMLAASGLSEALEDVLLEVVKLTDLPSALIYLYDDVGRRLRVAASTGMTADFVAAVDNIQLGEGFSGRVFLTGEPITTENVSEDWRLSRSIVKAMSLRSYACVPLPGKGRVLGTLGVIGASRHRFERHEVAFLVSIGRQIGYLLEMAERAYGSWGRSQLIHSDLSGITRVTDRQATVIRLLIAGFSPKQIGMRMRISEKTVRNHISHAYARAHVADRAHLLLWAIAHGLVPASEVPATLEGLGSTPAGPAKLEAPL
jgi:DNA-binding CsgD family transcriptional regulator/putative methionine-R-sulfoxide reductase with GAF domain